MGISCALALRATVSTMIMKTAPKLMEALGLPEHIEPKLVIAIGKPAETVVLTEAVDGKTTYYRDENDVHYVPKRPLEEILL